ncbi:MAG: IS1595 family transposase [Telluria sp.]
MSAATLIADKPSNFPLRRRTGTAAFHLSKEAVDFGHEDMERMSPLETVRYFATVIWGSHKEMPCPHCGTIDEHYWSFKELRWKCACCGKRFSVTSGTVFANRKLPLLKILKIAYSWANGASGKPALQLRRDWNISYPTAFTLVHKLREGLMRGHNTGMLCGVQEMDGMDVNGRRYKEKRNKPQGGARPAGKPAIPAELLKPTEDFVGPPTPPKWGKAAKQNVERRLLIVMRQRGVTKGKGASVTRIGIAVTECAETVTSMATTYASTESIVMSDEDPSYAGFRQLFADHRTVNHSKEFSKRDGTNNNQAESFNWRVRRAIEGVYLSASNKYLKDYAAEQAWREDVRRLSTAKKLAHLFRTVMSVGRSLWWCGYTHGRHRTEELLIEGARAAPGRGKQVGAKSSIPR